MELALFNVFGVVRVERSHVFAMATGIGPGGESIERSTSDDLDDPIIDLPDGESVVIQFAAHVNAGDKRITIATQNLSAMNGAPALIGDERVKRVLQRVVKKYI